MAESGRSHLDALFATARGEGRAVLLPYLTAGLPDSDSSVGLFEAMAEAGADGFEVGIPYSDPLMDGPTIHAAGLAALRGGATIESSIGVVAAVSARTGLPTIVMTYVNPVLRYGPERFGEMVAAAGASAVIVADLPVDEALPFTAAFDAVGLGTVLFVAPTTQADRLAAVATLDPVFLYGIAQLGVTGAREDGAAQRASALAARVRRVTDAPLVLGVGIATPEHARLAAEVADGVIVGSAIVERVLEADSATDAAASLRAAVGDLAAAVRVAK